MLERRKTNQFGPNGLELTFYTGKQAGKDIKLLLPDEKLEYGNFGSINPKLIAMKDIAGVVQSLYFINHTLETIYAAHEKYKGEPHRPILLDSLYNIGIHSFIDNTAKLFLYLLTAQCIKIGGGIEKNTTFLSITELFDKKENNDAFAVDVWDALFNDNAQHADLFQVVEWIHKIYYSYNMFTNTLIFNPDIACVCAIDIMSGDFEYVYHNHTLRQLALGLGDFLHHYFEFPEIELSHD